MWHPNLWCAYDRVFDLHAYLITFSGDLPAISKLLCLRGHGAYCPCCCSLIRGERILGTRNRKYYPVLAPPQWHGAQGAIWPLEPFPTNKGETLQAQLIKISQAATVSTRGPQDGIWHQLLIYVLAASIHAFSSVISTWHNASIFRIYMSNLIWSAVTITQIQTSRSCGPWISDSTPHLGPDWVWNRQSIQDNPFWICWSHAWYHHLKIQSGILVILDPVSRPYFLPHHCFPNAKYYWHYCDLVGNIKQCLQFRITAQEVDEMETSIIKWVEEYEWSEPLLQIYGCYLSIYFQVVLHVWPEEPTSVQLQHPCPYSYTGLHPVVLSSLDNLGVPHGVLLWQVRHPHYILTSSLCDSIYVCQVQCAAHTAQNVLLMRAGSFFLWLHRRRAYSHWEKQYEACE